MPELKAEEIGERILTDREDDTDANLGTADIVEQRSLSEASSLMDVPQGLDEVWEQIKSLRGRFMNAGIRGLAAYSVFKFAMASALGWKVFKVVVELGMNGANGGLRNFGVLNEGEKIPMDDIMREFLTTMVALEDGNPLLYRSLVGLASVGTTPAFWALIAALLVRIRYRTMFEEGGEAREVGGDEAPDAAE